MATSLKIEDTLKGRIQHLAIQRRRSPHWIMLEAICIGWTCSGCVRRAILPALNTNGLHSSTTVGDTDQDTRLCRRSSAILICKTKMAEKMGAVIRIGA